MRTYHQFPCTVAQDVNSECTQKEGEHKSKSAAINKLCSSNCKGPDRLKKSKSNSPIFKRNKQGYTTKNGCDPERASTSNKEQLWGQTASFE